ncbi:uncharacterized protein B0H18DRAFT_566139 [Fomitopsis serialis]|uniref:uncharacterized protein n=1 Tax=Fomitopsis serialis TaxID=139415 RepID=UPI002007CE6B|nr:uncharacterized protein B0H18DRAFT_566139 [Neoantrodia serialis]KAH9921318.1 hypothetical protein B0H18DRAFT_566139 [Neoantrodia serialis]
MGVGQRIYIHQWEPGLPDCLSTQIRRYATGQLPRSPPMPAQSRLSDNLTSPPVDAPPKGAGPAAERTTPRSSQGLSMTRSTDRAPTDAAVISPHPRAGSGSCLLWRGQLAAASAARMWGELDHTCGASAHEDRALGSSFSALAVTSINGELLCSGPGWAVASLRQYQDKKGMACPCSG